MNIDEITVHSYTSKDGNGAGIFRVLFTCYLQENSAYQGEATAAFVRNWTSAPDRHTHTYRLLNVDCVEIHKLRHPAPCQDAQELIRTALYVELNTHLATAPDLVFLQIDAYNKAAYARKQLQEACEAYLALKLGHDIDDIARTLQELLEEQHENLLST